MRYANRYDLLRLLLASGVFLYHLIALAEIDDTGLWEAYLADVAEASIQGFFIVSGALVYGSYERSIGLADYFAKRVRRLYPAYCVVILIPAMLSLALSGAALQVGQYVAANLVFLNFLHPTLPGLFAENRFQAVNGALWTLKIEVMFYLLLPILVWALRRSGQAWPIFIGFLVALSLTWWWLWAYLDHPLSPQLARQLPGQLMFFALGIAIWQRREWCRRYALMLTLGGIALLASTALIELGRLGHLIGLAALIAGAAHLPGPAINVTRWGDVSYGVYIVHFPIIQAFIAAGAFTALGVVPAALLCGLTVFGLSYGMWWLVERPALRVDSHYRTAQKP